MKHIVFVGQHVQYKITQLETMILDRRISMCWNMLKQMQDIFEAGDILSILSDVFLAPQKDRVFPVRAI